MLTVLIPLWAIQKMQRFKLNGINQLAQITKLIPIGALKGCYRLNKYPFVSPTEKINKSNRQIETSGNMVGMLTVTTRKNYHT